MSALSIEDLRLLKAITVVAMNRERRELEQSAGADLLSALRVDGGRAQPQLSQASLAKQLRVRELAALADQVGAVLDAQLVADDPDGEKYPAAHARQRERQDGRLP